MKRILSSMSRLAKKALFTSVDAILWVAFWPFRFLFSLIPTWIIVTGKLMLALGILAVPAVPYALTRHIDALEYVAGPDGTSWGCLALHVYRERQMANPELGQKAEPYVGLVATAQVMMTRYEERFYQSGHKRPQHVCDVIWAEKQASWTSWSREDRFTISTANLWDWYRASFASVDVLLDFGWGGLSPFAWYAKSQIQTADHYFNDKKVTPSWASKMQYCARVGNHVFYAKLLPKACTA